VFENRVLRRIFEPNRKDEMGRACSTHGEGNECIEDFGAKARRKETRET
jgi:hypothetical protein